MVQVLRTKVKNYFKARDVAAHGDFDIESKMNLNWSSYEAIDSFHDEAILAWPSPPGLAVIWYQLSNAGAAVSAAQNFFFRVDSCHITARDVQIHAG
jgi:hypothetical protein